ncbi:SRPBCC domain-containing protein [Reichenbachiella versicolor]|uniref:SRPBCC domain-containing protein n=1 Tax=Reichenbachiella versicolor TaxID=1821036 RepID=UPI000D6E6807|nr:SRPBCC domain-containing protein [Reichenbachiella versicolor]
MTNTIVNAQNGKSSTIKKTFQRTTTVSQFINSDASVIWSLLTNAKEFPSWNSTVISIDGKIDLGEKIKLKSTLDSTRTFKLKVKEFIPNKKLVWGDSMGKRTYTIIEKENGTQFTMTETIGGFMFPLFASKIPSFDTSFEQFTADLKKEAEAK